MALVFATRNVLLAAKGRRRVAIRRPAIALALLKRRKPRLVSISTTAATTVAMTMVPPIVHVVRGGVVLVVGGAPKVKAADGTAAAAAAAALEGSAVVFVVAFAAKVTRATHKAAVVAVGDIVVVVVEMAMAMPMAITITMFVMMSLATLAPAVVAVSKVGMLVGGTPPAGAGNVLIVVVGGVSSRRAQRRGWLYMARIAASSSVGSHGIAVHRRTLGPLGHLDGGRKCIFVVVVVVVIVIVVVIIVVFARFLHLLPFHVFFEFQRVFHVVFANVGKVLLAGFGELEHLQLPHSTALT
mmetsp:Transcript_6238/g.15505  ORF Transcript_6238/g.15505 Transcript_6238/m.15505 type:complete len:298 (-) Transcript_6238:3146-4039(-)